MKIINHEKKEMITLTNEEKESRKNQKVCYICETNLVLIRYKIPKEIPVVFYNGFTNDSHFIIEELTTEFQGKIDWLGEKTKKYITFSVPCIFNMFKLKWIDFYQVSKRFLIGNGKSISKHQKIQDKKFCKISSFVGEKVWHDPQKVIYNFSKHNLTEVEIYVLCKGLQFFLPPKTLEYTDYMVSFEWIFKDIKTTNLSNIQNETINPSFEILHFL